jgi:hypothetical protein
MTMRNAVFCDVTQFGSCKNRRIEGNCRLYHQGDNNRRARNLSVFLRTVLRLLVITNVVPSSPILFALIIQAIRSSETPILTKATGRNNQEDGILHERVRKPPVNGSTPSSWFGVGLTFLTIKTVS